MTFIDFFLYSAFVFIGLAAFNVVRYLLKIRKILKMNKDNPNIRGISIINGQIKLIEVKPSSDNAQQVIEWVTDPICGMQIEKKDAYRILKDGKEYFFCSWECREKFLQQDK